MDLYQCLIDRLCPHTHRHICIHMYMYIYIYVIHSIDCMAGLHCLISSEKKLHPSSFQNEEICCLGISTGRYVSIKQGELVIHSIVLFEWKWGAKKRLLL